MSCKNDIRREMIEKRKALDIMNGRDFAEMIRNLECYKSARTVMLYMPVNGECDVTSIMSDKKTFLIPVVDNDEIDASLAEGNFRKGSFNVPEPENREVFDKKNIDIVIVPGVAFDKKYNRMGYGKGCYDKFLQDIDAVKIGVCHSFQLLDEIPSEEHDIKMDIIVTENSVWNRENI